MIVRIMGEGQRELDDSEVAALSALDEELQRAVEADDVQAFQQALGTLLGRVREAGTGLSIDSLEPSDLLLPPADAGLNDVREMLGDEGLIPG